MSKIVITLVCGCDLPPSVKAIAKELAWYADDHGMQAFPSVWTISKRTGYTPRTVQKALRTLERMGLIIAVFGKAGGRGRPTQYRFDMANLRSLAGNVSPSVMSPQNHSSCAKGEPNTRERANSAARKGVPGSPEQYDYEGEVNHHASGAVTDSYKAALKYWLLIKDELHSELEAGEWELWVRPARLLRPMGKTLQIALPPNGRIMTLAKKNQNLLNSSALRHGWEGIALTRYPDDYELEQLRERFPEAYAQLSSALRAKR